MLIVRPVYKPTTRKHQIKTIIMKNGMQLFMAIAVMAFSINAEPAQSQTVRPIKNVVLVHGAFADGSGWEAVAKILEKDGYTVSVAQPPETSYAEDVKCAKAAVDAMGGPVVLVGHSYGGGLPTPTDDTH